MPGKNIPLGATIAVILALLIGVAVLFKTKEQPQLTAPYKTDVTSEDLTNTVYFTFSTPDTWVFKEQAEKDIRILGEDQSIQYGVIEDPAQKEIVYFATVAFDEEAEENKLSIYRYNELTYEFERIYRGSFGKGGSSYLGKNAWPVWRLIGYDHGKLVVLLEDGDNSPGPCAEPLLIGMDNPSVAALFTLDLQDPSSGLSEYTPPDDAVEAAETVQETCQKTFE